jgi:hypothetical protein
MSTTCTNISAILIRIPYGFKGDHTRLEVGRLPRLCAFGIVPL